MSGLGLAIPADLLTIALLAYGTYFRRYHRRDLLLAYVALNVGVLAVTAMLAGSGAGVGLGLGLFGILSIIRLRSDSITQEEVAYYFISLALGLVNGLHPGPFWLAPALSFLLVALMYVVDHPRLTLRSRRQKVVLDQAYPDVRDVGPALERLLRADVRYFVVLDLDLVTDTTVVDVRYRTRADAPAAVRPFQRYAS
ncbi:uncharacterized protein DUF4956 [Kribbella sp. VKM Ac-2569]|uniref:DUF4956 domain-containing protein n=1 Tax=Kribbella sp. VKM Ac-2569 TaxID=2512220 RepID=UPI00102C1174|nr:DUF4956 domain-containing protein [Kribbella sp. VKM Ac-2569]RZT27654.1 uncharacterized protein DUF4956 [Kribbella sp. VKM Ac-2569]